MTLFRRYRWDFPAESSNLPLRSALGDFKALSYEAKYLQIRTGLLVGLYSQRYASYDHATEHWTSIGLGRESSLRLEGPN